MPYKDLERKKEWERMHRLERLARRRELRRADAAEQTTRPKVIHQANGELGFLIPLIAGGSLAASSPKLGSIAGGLTLTVAAFRKKDWAWWTVGCVILAIALLFYLINKDRNEISGGRND
jgi:hypothetical protein